MTKKGFTLVEIIVGSAVFSVIAIAAYGAFTNLFKLANANQARVLAVGLAHEQFEVIRNMPYVKVGIENSIFTPGGTLPQTRVVERGGIDFTVNLTIRNVNLSSSTVQSSSRLVEVEVDCDSCRNFRPVVLTGYVSPANLQTAGDGGAMVIKVFDSNGDAVKDAFVNITNIVTSSSSEDVTNNAGILNVIGVPPYDNAYRVVVTKDGYSTDRTYPIGGSGNPDPIKTDATVINKEVSQLSFFIDRLSTVSFTSFSPTCSPVGSFHFSLVGSKQIGSNVPKYEHELGTDSGGTLHISNMEWDTYNLAPIDTTYDLAGISALNPISVLPNSVVEVGLMVVPKSSKSLMVTVLDSVTKLPVTDAVVRLTNPGFDLTKTTGQGYFGQTDWSRGSGQEIFSDSGKYYADDGDVDVFTSPGNVSLKSVFGEYNPDGVLESSIFDIGLPANFLSVIWNPVSEPVLAGLDSVRFQIATNATMTPTTTWNYIGPDGTGLSYYTVSGSHISDVNDGDKYARYKLFVSTETATVTPTISDVSLTYTASCMPPGQVLFQGLSSGDYDLIVSKSGYTTSNTQVTIGSSWQQQSITIGP